MGAKLTASPPLSLSCVFGAGLVGRGGFELLVFAGAQEVGHDAEGAGDSFGHLAEEGVGEIDVGALAVVGVDEASSLGVLAFVVHLGGGFVMGVPGIEEAVAALFDPVVEVGCGDLVGPAEEWVVGVEDFGFAVLFDDTFCSCERQGVGAVVVIVLGALVLDDDGATVADVLEETVVGGLELGACGVGADAEDDGVEAGEVAGGDVLRGEEGDVDAEVLEGLRRLRLRFR